MLTHVTENWKRCIIASTAGLLALYSLGLVYEGFIEDRYSQALTGRFVDTPAAQRAFDQLRGDAPPAQRIRAAQRLVDGDPANPGSWGAIAYNDWVAHDRLSAVGVQALGRSYAVSFFDRPQAVWRVTFAVENWASLTPQIRQAVMAEAKVVLHDPTLGPRLRSQLQSVETPEGRVAARLLVAMSGP